VTTRNPVLGADDLTRAAFPPQLGREDVGPGGHPNGLVEVRPSVAITHTRTCPKRASHLLDSSAGTVKPVEHESSGGLEVLDSEQRTRAHRLLGAH
jgi:hypothetical protein